MPTLDEIKAQTDGIPGAKSWVARREVKELPNVLAADEPIEMLVTGRYERRNGVLVATDRRAVFVDKGMLGGARVESFPYERIGSVQYETGMVFGKLKIMATGNSAEIDLCPKAVVQEMAQCLNSHLLKGQPSAAAPPASGTDELEKLAELRDKGILTEEEFTAKKRQVLGL